MPSQDPTTPLRRIPELRDVLSRYGASEASEPPHVVIGVVDIEGVGSVGGILAFADNEMYAHQIRRALRSRANAEFGGVGVKRTRWHRDGETFDVSSWRQRVGRLPAGSRGGSDVARLA